MFIYRRRITAPQAVCLVFCVYGTVNIILTQSHYIRQYSIWSALQYGPIQRVPTQKVKPFNVTTKPLQQIQMPLTEFVTLTSLQYDFSVQGVSIQKGKPFNVTLKQLQQIGMPLTKFVNITHEESVLNDYVFVTGGSRDYLFGVYALIQSVHKFYPGKMVIVYILGGVSEKTIEQMSQFCNVIVKQFEFERYPKHVQKLTNYAWKPLIIHEVLRTYPGVFWLDSSAMMTSSKMDATLNDARSTNGVILIRNTGHSIYAVTHPQMYEYLPSFPAVLKRVQQREAGATLIYRTEEIYSQILTFWVLCALDERCIGKSTVPRGCHFAEDHFKYYAGCHRFDQSAINIILANYFSFDDMAFKSSEEPMTISRDGSHVKIFQVKTCS